MAPDAEGTFAECHELIDEMQRIYSTDEEVVKVRQLDQQFAEVHEVCNTREAHMQSVIKEMTKRVTVAEKKATPPEPAGAHHGRLAQVEGEKRAAGDYLASMEQEAQSLEQMQADLKARAASLKVKRQQIDAMATEEVPRTRHELSLYAHISKISWQFDAPNRIQGRVNAHDFKDVRIIDFPEGEISKFQLANDLWELVA